MKHPFKILTAVMITAASLSACQKQEQVQEDPKIENCAIIHETEFGGVYIKSTIDDFNKLGFEYGDSVNVEFSNGFKLEDVPYYNGYYVDAGQPLLIAYPGYDYIKAAVNYGDDLWETAGLQQKNDPQLNLWLRSELDEHDTASVYLNERGKYADIQAARDIHYYDERERYTTDEEFANFRTIRMGSIAENKLYRSASPCDNQHNRAPYVDQLMEQAGVKGILNLSDSHLKIRGYIEKDNFDSPYFLSLYQNDQVVPLALNMNYLSQEFAVTVAQGLVSLTEIEPPYLIHCTEGKDRTGFVCMLVEALAGAGYQQIADDYMVTYDNYYGITAESEPDKYRTILEKNLDAMIRSIVGDESVDITTADLSVYAKNYLIKAGMSEAEIAEFLDRICD
ncbi:MAG: tyrosine-protein phosphatase [Erysipelotrichaceae bacterium]|nr:tyrosine-protein phosphatase [Erysipelotrichaceae bacterium]